MEIKQLRYFIAVADTLNFSRAAESVYLSQSALSRQIMELEQEIGLPLFIRNTRSVELTDAGRALRIRAKELISGWEKMIPEVRRGSTGDGKVPSLIIGVDSRSLSEPTRRHAFLGTLYALRRERPGLRVLIRNYDYQRIVKGLSDGTLDCALLLDRELPERSEFASECFGADEMVLAFRSRNRHRNADYADVISSRGLILVDQEPQGLYHIIRILNDLHLEPQIRFCESLEDMTMTVETGESAMILPKSVYDRIADPDLQMLRLPGEHTALSLTLLYPRESTNTMLPELLEQLRGSFE